MGRQLRKRLKRERRERYKKRVTSRAVQIGNRGRSGISMSKDPRIERDIFGEDVMCRYSVNLVFLLDTSGSMHGEPINQLNAAMAEAVQAAEEAALNKEVQLFMRVVQFNSEAKWIYGDTRHGVEHIDWMPLTAYGGTDTAGAIELAQSVMHREILGVRNYRPVVILITDGLSNDPQRTIEAVEKLKDSLKSSARPSKDMIVRIAIGVPGADQNELNNFASVGNVEHADGTIDENVPLVFNIDDVMMLSGLVKKVIRGSIDFHLPGIIPPEGNGDNAEWI